MDGIYYCPHHLDENCDCQKPKTGLLERAQQEHQLDLTPCFVVGDTGGSDMLAASRGGARKVLVRTGWGESLMTKYRNQWPGAESDYIEQDLLEAADWIKRELEKGEHNDEH